MNDVPREKLREIIVTYGRSVCDDPRRCEALLRDYCGEYKREINVLIGALKERVAADLMSSASAMPLQVLIAQLVTRLEDELALAEEAAKWAVESWTIALGMSIEGATSKPSSRKQKAISPQSRSIDAAISPTTPLPSTPIQPAPPPASTTPSIVVAKTSKGQYSTIGEAIRNATPGTQIMVHPGVYRESVSIDKSVQIIGEGAVERIVIEAEYASAVVMQSGRAKVQGISLRNKAGAGINALYPTVRISMGELTLEDCNITSKSGSCVEVSGLGISPIIRRCRIFEGKAAGIDIYSGAAGIIEDCEIYANAIVGIAVGNGARPAIRRCRIHDGKAVGVQYRPGGGGTIEDCEIYANNKTSSLKPEMLIEQGSNPSVLRCKIHGSNNGLTIHSGGTIDDCDIYDTFDGVQIMGGNPILRGCRVYTNRSSGVSMYSIGTLDNCEIFANGFSGIFIASGGNSRIKHCKVYNNKYAGLTITDKGTCVLEGSSVTSNGGSGIDISRGGDPTVQYCQVKSNRGAGIQIHDGGRGTIEDCDLSGNFGGAWNISFGLGLLIRRNRNKEQ